MIKFDLSEIIDEPELTPALDDLINISRTLSIRSSEYAEHVRDLTVGTRPTEGLVISNLQDSGATLNFIMNKQGILKGIYDNTIPELYATNVFQLLIASGTLPLGWIFTKTKNPNVIYDNLKQVWDTIALGSYEYGSLHPLIKSFGLVVRKVYGHKQSDIMFFVIPSTNVTDKQLLETVIHHECDNDAVLIMTESEYDEHLIDGLNYDFLVKFDKFEDMYDGVSFRARTKLVESIPTYALRIGCNPACVLFRNSNDVGTNPHFKTVDFKRGESVRAVIYVPINYMISIISLNGTAYFNNTDEMNSAGISIVETDISTLTGYRTFDVVVSGLRDNADLYIEACEDMTYSSMQKHLISSKSTICVGDEEVSFNLITTSPFVYLDLNKIKIWAKKDDESEEELVPDASFFVSGRCYKERRAGFVEPLKKPNRPHKPLKHHNHHHNDVMRGNNPYIIDNRHHKHRHDEPKLVGNVMIYTVYECGMITVNIGDYTDYKYFRISFDNRAIIISIKTGLDNDYIDIIPRIRDTRFVNDTLMGDDDIDYDDSDNDINDDITQSPSDDDKDNVDDVEDPQEPSIDGDTGIGEDEPKDPNLNPDEDTIGDGGSDLPSESVSPP